MFVNHLYHVSTSTFSKVMMIMIKKSILIGVPMGPVASDPDILMKPI